MGTQLERLNQLFEFLVRVQEFWTQPWTRLEQLPWSSTLQTNSEGATWRIAPDAPLYAALTEVADVIEQEPFRLRLGQEWLEGPEAACPLRWQDVRVRRLDSGLELKAQGPSHLRHDLLRNLGLPERPDPPYQVSPCSVLYLEPLALDYSEFLARLRKALADVDDLPASLATLTGPSPAKPEPLYRQPLWTLSVSPEQEEVAHRLAVRPLVLVEGGPGTGKSHLVANLLGHCLALGLRVLVTGPSSATLRPILNALPPDLRALCVGPGQSPDLELSKRLEKTDPKTLLKEAEVQKTKREELLEEQDRIEEQLFLQAMLEYSERDDERVSELGRRLQPERDDLGWIPGPVGLKPNPLSPDQVAELYDSNRLTLHEEEQLSGPLPDRAELLTATELASLSELWREVENYPDHNYWSGTPPLESLEYLPLAASRVVSSLRESDPWFLECVWRARTSEKHRQTYAVLLRELEQNRKERNRILKQIGDRDPTLPFFDDEAQEICQELLEHVNRGGTVTGIAATFLKPRWKKFLKGAQVRGKSPTTDGDFQALLEAISLKRLNETEDQRWAQEMVVLGLMGAEQRKLDRIDTLKRALSWNLEVFSDFEHQAAGAGLLWERAMELASEEGGSGRVLRRLLSFLEHELEPLLERRKAYLDVCQMMKRADQEARYLKSAERSSPNPIWGTLRQALVERDERAYEQALEQLAHWESLAPLARRRRELLDLLEPVAPAWVDAIRERSKIHGRTQVPGNVVAAWEHRQAAQWLRQLQEQPGPEVTLKRLFEVREEVLSVTRDLVTQRAWAMLGMRAGKRELSSQDCSPAWVIPLDQVLERFSPDETRFDLLVVEHAGLCDLRALGLLALAERALILGDPERLCPEPAAQHDELARLAAPYLAEHHRARPTSLLTWLDQGDSLCLTASFRARTEILQLLRLLESSVAQAPGRSPSFPTPPFGLLRSRLEARDVAAIAMAVLREHPGQSLAVACCCVALGRQVRRLLEQALPAETRPLVGSPLGLQGEERDRVLVALPDTERKLVSSADRRRLLASLSLAREQVLLLSAGDPENDYAPGDLRRELVVGAEGIGTLSLGGSGWRGLVAQTVRKAGYRMHPFNERSVLVQGDSGWVLVSMLGESTPPTRAELVTESWLEQYLGWRVIRLRASSFWIEQENSLQGIVAQLEALGLSPLGDSPASERGLRLLKAAQELRRSLPSLPAPAVEAGADYGPGDFNWTWQPLVRRLLNEQVRVAPADTAGHELEVERQGRRLTLSDRKGEGIDLSVSPSRLEEALEQVLAALGPSEPPLPRPELVATTSEEPGHWSIPFESFEDREVTVELSRIEPSEEPAVAADSSQLEQDRESPAEQLEPSADREVTTNGEQQREQEEVTSGPAQVLDLPEENEPVAERHPAEAPTESPAPEPVKAPTDGKRAATPERKMPRTQPSGYFSPSSRFEFGVAHPASRPARPAGEPRHGGERSQPAPPPPPPPRPAEPEAPPAPGPVAEKRAQPARPPASPRPDRISWTEATGRAASPAAKPPAPKSMPNKAGPPRTSLPLPRKVAPAPPAEPPAPIGLEAIRALMLQAFELIQPVPDKVVTELVEGVNEVGLERGGREQRRAPRLLCCYDVLGECEGESFQAVVSEVSLTGVRLELSNRLTREALVVLRPELSSDLSPVQCQVRWCRRSAEGMAAGLAFHEDPEQLSRSWVAVLLHSLGFGPEHSHQRRKTLRVPTPRLKVLVRGKGMGTALDLGVGGMLIETTARLALDERVELTLGPHENLPAVQVQARIANQRQRKVPAYGLAFVDLTPSTMKALGSYVLSFLAARAKGKRP